MKRDAETQSSLLLAAVEKAVEESLQLSSCRGEAKNDLFDSIVDLLTETFLRDLTASRTLAPSHPLDLPARDESVQPTSTSEPPTNCAPIASPIDEMPARNNRPSALAPRKAISKRVGNRTLRPRGAWRKARVVLPSNIPDAEPVEKNEEIDEPSAKKNSDVSEKGTAKRQGARVTRSMGASVVDDHIVEIEESIVDSGRPRRKHAPTKPPRSATRSARRKRPAEDAIDLRGRKKHQKVHKGKAPKKESTLPSDSRPLSSGEMACERVTRSTSISPYADEECEIEESIVDSGRPRRKNLVVRNDKRKSKPSKAVVRDPDPVSPNITDETEQVRKQRLPWWMTSDSHATRVDQSEDREKLFTGFTMAVIRSCVRESWSADALKESFDSDPSSARGQAFSAVSSTMLLLEQARHMGQCYLNWSPRIIRALNHYRVVEWSVIEPEASFDQFVGCELCRGHRAATCRLVLKGPCYDSCDFWPGSSRIEVLSAEEDRAGIASVAVELEGGTTNDHLINVNISEGQDELWLDPQCLRKCLLFHQLVHATSIMADELRGMVEDELREGMVQLDESDDENVSLPERLERTLVQALSVNASFLQKRTSFLEDIVQLGYLYFADKQVESDDDSGLRGAGRASIYDDPIELNDTKYRSCIDELVRQSHIRANGEPYATF